MPPVLRAHVLTGDMVTAKGELTQVGNTIRFRDVAGDTGSGSLTVGRDEPLLSTVSARPEIGDVIRVDVGTTPAFAYVVEDIDYRHLAENGEVDEGWTLAGRGTLSAWERSVVWPQMGVGRALWSDQRVWNFASPELSDASWGTAVATEKAHVGVNFGLVELFPDVDAYWIWDRTVSGGIPSGLTAPSGSCYFSTTFTKAAYGYVELWAAADDSFEAWVDGVQVVTDPGYYRGNVARAKFALDAGSHSIRIRGTNQNAAKAGVLATVVQVDSGGLYGSVICRTDATWKCLSYPSAPPGFTAGQILRILLDEGQDRGGLDGVAVGFGDTTDTDGATWPTLPEFAIRTGSTVYEAIRQLQQVHIDARMRANALTLDAWVKGTAGDDVAGVSFGAPTGDPAVDNIRSLTHEVTGVGAVVP